MRLRIELGRGGAAHWLSRIVMTVFVVAFLAVAASLAGPALLPLIAEAGPMQIALGVGFGLLFLAGPVVMLRRIWRRRPQAESGVPAARSISEAAVGRRSFDVRWMGALFALAGLGFSAVFVIPLVRMARASMWDETECEILESSVVAHSGDDGSTYSIQVRYRYVVDGTTYTSERYRFLGGSSSGYDGKKKVVDRLAPGTRTTCWVDPDEPSEAVLHRGLSWELVFVLLPMVFVAIGAALIAAGAKRRKSPAAPPGLAFAEVDGVSAEPALTGAVEWIPEVEPGPRELEPDLGPGGKLGCITVVALFWNGITGVFAYQVVRGWMAGSPDGCLTVFIVPFVLVGLALLASVPYQALALANPRPHLVLAAGAAPLGGTIAVTWRFRGAAHRIHSLKLTLEGQESATYRRGTSTHTATRVFATLPVYESAPGQPIEAGAAELRIPVDTMHTFHGGRNRIDWRLVLHGAVRRWPDVNERFEVVVQPFEENA